MRRHCLPLIAVLATLPGFAMAQPAAGPDGHYCGKLVSGNETVTAETTFETTNGGVMVGQYTFRDQGGVTQGLVTQANRQTDHRYLLTWHDRYGQGQLLVTFDSDFQGFDGYWGSGAPNPNLTWTGRRCQEPIG